MFFLALSAGGGDPDGPGPGGVGEPACGGKGGDREEEEEEEEEQWEERLCLATKRGKVMFVEHHNYPDRMVATSCVLTHFVLSVLISDLQ